MKSVTMIPRDFLTHTYPNERTLVGRNFKNNIDKDKCRHESIKTLTWPLAGHCFCLHTCQLCLESQFLYFLCCHNFCGLESRQAGRNRWSESWLPISDKQSNSTKACPGDILGSDHEWDVSWTTVEHGRLVTVGSGGQAAGIVIDYSAHT